MTQAAIDQNALQYALTGKMPSLGLSGTGTAAQARRAVLNRAAEINTNGNLAANKAQLTSLSDNLTTQTQYFNTIQRSVNTVDSNLQLLQNAANSVNDSSSPLINQWTNNVKSGILGSGALASYKAAIQTVRSEYSNILARGGTVTDTVRGEAATLIPDNISKDQLNQVLATLKSEGQNVLSGAQQQVQSVQGQINGIISSNTSSGNLSVQAPDGKTYSFKTQADLNSFKKAAGIQ